MVLHNITLDYIHGTHSEEQARLSRLNGLLNDACLKELEPAYGSRILDVGSGLGQFTRLMARSCSGFALGIERSEEQLELARVLAAESEEEALAEFREGDASLMPLKPDERGSFDIAHARFILEHVPEPHRVVYQMVQAVKPRGRVVLMDDDHDLMTLYPPAEAFMRVWRAYLDSYASLGNDPQIGRKLPELLVKAGALPVRTALIQFGGCKGQDQFETLCDNMEGLIDGAKQAMLRRELCSEGELEIGMADFARWRRCEYANMVFATPWAEGVRL